MEVATYLRNVVSAYLSDRKIYVEGGKKRLTAGVPQGSVLGPLLWNLMYDGVLRVNMPDGVEVYGYADDVGIMIKANDVCSLNQKSEAALERLDDWITQHGLELAPEKTAALIMKGPRKRDAINFAIRGQRVVLSKAVKYLGVWFDSQGTYGEHVVQTVKKAERRSTALARILPNVGGPSMSRRLVLLGVVHSTILYGAGIWSGALRIGRYRAMLESAQRKALLRVTRAYKTVSALAAQVIAGVLPIDLLAEERKEWESLAPHERTPAKKSALREEFVEKWQSRWEAEVDRAQWEAEVDGAQWTKRLISDVRRWVACRHRCIDYFLCQFLTGHGSFRAYTKRIGEDETDLCQYCREVDTTEHTVLCCIRWDRERLPVTTRVPDWRDPTQVMEIMMENKNAWSDIAGAIRVIMSGKEREERARQQADADAAP